MAIRTVVANGNELDPVPIVLRGVQANFLEKMPATSFYPAFLHQTTSSEVMRRIALGNLVNDLVDEFLWEVGHGGSWFTSFDDQSSTDQACIDVIVPTAPPVSADSNVLCQHVWTSGEHQRENLIDGQLSRSQLSI